jgi:hypothetical protein
MTGKQCEGIALIELWHIPSLRRVFSKPSYVSIEGLPADAEFVKNKGTVCCETPGEVWYEGSNKTGTGRPGWLCPRHAYGDSTCKQVVLFAKVPTISEDRYFENQCPPAN